MHLFNSIFFNFFFFQELSESFLCLHVIPQSYPVRFMSSAFTAFIDKFFQDTTLQLQINPFNQLIANFSESACLVDSYFVTYSWINWSLHNCETSFSWTKALGSISSCAFPYFHIQPFCAATCCGLVPATIPIFFRRFTLIFLDFCLDI